MCEQKGEEKTRLSQKHIYTSIKCTESISIEKCTNIATWNHPKNRHTHTYILIIYVNHSLAMRQQAEPTPDNYDDNQTECARYVFEILWKVVCYCFSDSSNRFFLSFFLVVLLIRFQFLSLLAMKHIQFTFRWAGAHMCLFMCIVNGLRYVKCDVCTHTK